MPTPSVKNQEAVNAALPEVIFKLKVELSSMIGIFISFCFTMFIGNVCRHTACYSRFCNIFEHSRIDKRIDGTYCKASVCKDTYLYIWNLNTAKYDT